MICMRITVYDNIEHMNVLLVPGTGEIEEKKSRFIAHLRAVSTEEEAASFFEETKKKYWDAKHNCTAFILGKDGELSRCNDDKEPPQTAGRPMLNVLQHAKLTNVACVVTRYFGGTLLGTGGLIKAYSDAVADALLKSKIGEEIEGLRLDFMLDYDAYSKVQYELRSKKIEILDVQFDERVRGTFIVPKKDEEELKKSLTEATNGRIVFTDAVKTTLILEPQHCIIEERKRG